MNDNVMIDEVVVDPEVEAARERAATGAFTYLSKVLSSLPVSFYSGTLGIAPRIEGGKSNNAEGVADSWTDDAVREARTTREEVSVTLPNGNVRRFKSVGIAFKELRLPMSKHIRFRLKLKQERAAAFEYGGKPYAFTIVPAA
ncbi:hypothetical protein [Burkholderia seminalis]|uniref:hypothetical protein n=1 Tax=Burkholderia seminalis TaxID=488731 RepID=UPI000F5A4C95|nr:hypothetical protein [Burkholderia seminalis]